jgi:hypothetical protein
MIKQRREMDVLSHVPASIAIAENPNRWFREMKAPMTPPTLNCVRRIRKQADGRNDSWKDMML